MRKLLCLFTLVFLVQTTWAEMPITVWGVAKDSKGIALPDGRKNITFTLYDSPESDTAIWSEQQSALIKDGRFSANLESLKSLKLPFTKTYWLGMKVGQGNELLPRLELKPGENVETTLKSAMADNTLDMAYDAGGAVKAISMAIQKI